MVLGQCVGLLTIVVFQAHFGSVLLNVFRSCPVAVLFLLAWFNCVVIHRFDFQFG